MPPIIIEANNLQVEFNRTGAPPVVALRDLNLSVREGEFTAVVGHSGAGKTTLLRCLTGFVQVTAGKLAVAGTDVPQASTRELYALRRRVATIYQHFNLVERATALENVLHGRLGYVGTLRSLIGLFPRSDREIAYQILVELGLGDRALQRVDQLSGGEQQRVAIARALAQKPRLILADEPAASLDIALTRLVLETLKRLHQQKGLTVLVNLHDLELARSYVTRIVALRRGQLVFDGRPDQLTLAIVGKIYHGEEKQADSQELSYVRSGEPSGLFTPRPIP